MAIKSANQITIVDVTDAYSVILTSEAFTFVGGTSGAASGLTCTTQAVAYCGSNQCPSVQVVASEISCPAGISAAVSNSGGSAPTITFTTTATVSNACEATVPVTVDGITINKKFSFAVAKQGATGSTGKGVKSTSVTYQAGTSGTIAPTGSWSSDIPTVAAQQFLWTKTVTTYTDNSSTTAYSVGMMGATGATGKGVKGTSVTYQAGTSGTSAPTGTWTTSIPTVAAKQFLWTKTVTTYTDNTTSTAYSVGMMGATGATGAAGADAITLSITSSNGTVFKNSNGSTVLTAHVYKAGAEVTIADGGAVSGNLGSIKWYKNGSTTAIATSKSITVSASDVLNAVAYTCQLEG